MVICRRVTYFTDSAMIKYYQKTCSWNSKSTKNKNYVKNYDRCTTLKHDFLWFTLGHMTVMRISKYTTRKWFLSLTMFCKLLHPCYSFIYTEGYQIINYSCWLKRLTSVSCHFIMSRCISEKPAGNKIR